MRGGTKEIATEARGQQGGIKNVPQGQAGDLGEVEKVLQRSAPPHRMGE